MTILVTGGLGYIGSHTVLELLKLNYDIIILDDLSNSLNDIKSRIESITNKKNIKLYNSPIQDKSIIQKIFSENKIDFVMHFAGLKSVSESIKFPIKYYETNIGGSINLINAMIDYNVKKIIFSSSATVYDKKQPLPLTEGSATELPETPYGVTKLLVERILKDLFRKDNSFRIGILRYFNPIGAHKSGLIGDQFNNVSNNLIPNILRVIDGKQSILNIYGNNYKTHDGTCIRDYFHVTDLANGQISAMNFINKNSGYHIWNLGSGIGYSTLEIVKMFEKKIKRKIPIEIHGRREGDLAEYWCDPSKANKELNWKAVESLDIMVSDILNYLKKIKI